MLHRHAGVWIDHRKAMIVGLTARGEVITLILSRGEDSLERGAGPPIMSIRESNQAAADDDRQIQTHIYYDAVISILRNYASLLLFGPDEAKGELQTRLVKAKLGARVGAVVTEERMTDPQIIAKVRTYFWNPEPPASARDSEPRAARWSPLTSVT